MYQYESQIGIIWSALGVRVGIYYYESQIAMLRGDRSAGAM